MSAIGFAKKTLKRLIASKNFIYNYIILFNNYLFPLQNVEKEIIFEDSVLW